MGDRDRRAADAAGKQLAERDRAHRSIDTDQQRNAELSDKDRPDLADLHHGEERPRQQDEPRRRGYQHRLAAHPVRQPGGGRDDHDNDHHVGRVDDAGVPGAEIGKLAQPRQDVDEADVERDRVDQAERDPLDDRAPVAVDRLDERKAGARGWRIDRQPAAEDSTQT